MFVLGVKGCVTRNYGKKKQQRQCASEVFLSALLLHNEI